MKRDEIAKGRASGPVAVETATGKATFQRSDASLATLELEYRIPGLQVDLSRASLQEGVEAICQLEIRLVRDALRSLGGELAAQLSDEGTDPVIRRNGLHDEERTWQHQRTALIVDPTRHYTTDTLKGYKGASDQRIVEESVRLMIDQREQSIRQVYAQLLADVQAKREGIARQEQ
jgi:hypothetical protein